MFRQVGITRQVVMCSDSAALTARSDVNRCPGKAQLTRSRLAMASIGPSPGVIYLNEWVQIESVACAGWAYR